MDRRRRSWSRSRGALLALVLGMVGALLGPASPASAQQLVNGSEDGDLAFIAFALTCFVFLGVLLVIDRLRPKDE